MKVRGKSGRWATGVVVVVVLVSATVALVLAMGTSSSTSSDHEVVITPGTAALADAGQDIDFFPPGFTMRVGQTLVIRNLVDTTAAIGPFVVGPGETLTKQFTEPGVIEGYCSFVDGDRTFFEVVR